MTLIVSALTLVMGLVVMLVAMRRSKTQIVMEDNVAVTVDKHGFIKRTLPAGRHVLHPFERVDFILETKTQMTSGRAMTIATGDGLLVNINWSGLYRLRPDLITENVSQRLRSLPKGPKAIERNVDIFLRKLVGSHQTGQLFSPAVRERLDRHLTQLLADRLRPLGIEFNSLSLQAIELPKEVVEALNKAKAIETLDGTIRRLDPVTREVVRGAYQLDEILQWDAYLPTPTRLMKRLEAIAH